MESVEVLKGKSEPRKEATQWKALRLDVKNNKMMNISEKAGKVKKEGKFTLAISWKGAPVNAILCYIYKC